MKSGLLIAFALLMCSTMAYSQKALYLYGGSGHDVYLGCLNCDAYSLKSVWNENGTFGSQYSHTSIWNSYCIYGSEYSSYSPFNSYASYPPVIVDADGNFYGYFTVNESHNKRADFSLATIIYKYHDLIKDNVEKWHDKIFE